MTHLKRLNAPVSWKIPKKEYTFIVKPRPGRHSITNGIPFSILMKDALKFTKTTRETKKLLNEGKILIDGKKENDWKSLVGIMDIIEMPQNQLHYIVLFDENGKLITRSINKDEAKLKTYKIVNKKILKGKKTQLNLYDGNNLLISKDNYKVGDSIVISIPKKEIKEHLKFEKGALIYLIGGKHIGKYGILDQIKHFKGIEEDRIIIKSKNESIETLKSYAFVVKKQY